MLTHRAKVVMAGNHGLLSREQARDAGLTTSEIKHLLRSGVLVALRRGVYVDGEHWRALDPFRAQHRVRTRAALMLMRRACVLSHDSAAYELGLEIITPPSPRVHITRPGSTAAWTRFGVSHHLARYLPGQVVRVEDLDVLDAARTAVDIAREHGSPYGEVACDSALRMGVTRVDLEKAAAPMTSWPNVRRVHAALDFAALGPQTAAESLGKHLVQELGLGEPDPQFPVRVRNGGVRWCDLQLGPHVFEIDGSIKYRLPSAGGVAERPPHEVVWAEKKRDRDLWREGLGASHLIWEDFWPPHRAAALTRLKEEYEDSVAHFGPRLSERLARQAREIRSQRSA